MTPCISTSSIHQIEALPVTSKQIAETSRRHPILSRVLHYIRSGWPATQCDPAMQPYWNRRHELTIEQGRILWGIHVIVPQSPRLSSKRATPEPSWHYPYETGCTKLCMVARAG